MQNLTDSLHQIQVIQKTRKTKKNKEKNKEPKTKSQALKHG